MHTAPKLYGTLYFLIKAFPSHDFKQERERERENQNADETETCIEAASIERRRTGRGSES